MRSKVSASRSQLRAKRESESSASKVDKSSTFRLGIFRVHKNNKRPEGRLFIEFLAERTGLEPATPGVTGRYSNQLNYRSAAALKSWRPLGDSNPCTHRERVVS